MYDPDAPDALNDILFCLNGIERSGTIWATRLLAQALDSPSLTRAPNVDDYDLDPVVWGLDRPNKPIRRIHYPAPAYDATELDAPVVLLVRHPCAVALSQYHYYEKKSLHAHALWLAVRWNEFYGSWIDDERVSLILHYETLLKNPLPLTRVVADMFSLEHIPAAQLEQAVYDNDFSRMVNPIKRKGEVAEWKKVMQTNTARRVLRTTSKVRRHYGYQ